MIERNKYIMMREGKDDLQRDDMEVNERSNKQLRCTVTACKVRIAKELLRS